MPIGSISSYPVSIDGRNGIVMQFDMTMTTADEEAELPGVPPVGDVSLFEAEITTAGTATTLAPELGKSAAFALGTIDEIAHADAPLAYFQVPSCAKYSLPPADAPVPAARNIYYRPMVDATDGTAVVRTRITIFEGHGT